MPDETSVLEHPDVKAALAKFQSNADTKIAALAKQNEELEARLGEFTRAVDSIEVGDDYKPTPKSVSVLGKLRAATDDARAAAAEKVRQASARELVKHKAATDLYLKYQGRGVKLQDLLALDDEVTMREHIITVLDAAMVSKESGGRTTPSGTNLPTKPKTGKPDFLTDVQDLFAEGKREGRTVFQTQSFD